MEHNLNTSGLGHYLSGREWQSLQMKGTLENNFMSKCKTWMLFLCTQWQAQTEVDLRVSEDNVSRLKDEMLAGRRLFAEFRKNEAVLKSEISSLCGAASMKDTQLLELKQVVSGEQSLRLAAEEALKKATKTINVAHNKLQDTLQEVCRYKDIFTLYMVLL